MSQSQYSNVSDDENEIENISITEMSVLVMVITNHRILLSKSQVPEMKEKKAKAIEVAKEELFKTIGKRFDSKVVQKKIANMKTRVKSKADRNKTGNRKIKLLDWEEKFLKLMEHDENPVFTRVKGKEVISFL